MAMIDIHRRAPLLVDVHEIRPGEPLKTTTPSASRTGSPRASRLRPSISPAPPFGCRARRGPFPPVPAHLRRRGGRRGVRGFRSVLRCDGSRRGQRQSRPLPRGSGPSRAARCRRCVSMSLIVPAQQLGRDHHRPHRSNDAVKPEKAPNSCTHFKGCRGHLFGEDDRGFGDLRTKMTYCRYQAGGGVRRVAGARAHGGGKNGDNQQVSVGFRGRERIRSTE